VPSTRPGLLSSLARILPPLAARALPGRGQNDRHPLRGWQSGRKGEGGAKPPYSKRLSHFRNGLWISKWIAFPNACHSLKSGSSEGRSHPISAPYQPHISPLWPHF
jgi:hypothetical protein